MKYTWIKSLQKLRSLPLLEYISIMPNKAKNLEQELQQ